MTETTQKETSQTSITQFLQKYKNVKTSNQLSTTPVTPFELEDFINNLGGLDNIIQLCLTNEEYYKHHNFPMVEFFVVVKKEIQNNRSVLQFIRNQYLNGKKQIEMIMII